MPNPQARMQGFLESAQDIPVFLKAHTERTCASAEAILKSSTADPGLVEAVTMLTKELYVVVNALETITKARSRHYNQLLEFLIGRIGKRT